MDGLAADARPVLLSYRTLGLGDLLTAVPALRALRRAFPEHRHVLVTPAWLAPLVAVIDAVDVHLPLAELAPVPPSLGAVDVAVNLHGRGPQSLRVVRALNPSRLIAFGDRVRWCDAEHEVQRWCRLLAEHGLDVDPGDLDVPPVPGPVPQGAAGATVLHPGAKSAARRWPVGRFAAIARHEHERGHRVVVTGGPGEVELARAVAGGAGLDPEAVLAGRLDIGGLLRVVAAADRVICGDTGVAHVATAVGTPSVLLFGPVAPDLWGPPPDRRDRHRVLWAGRLGDPHGAETDPGLLAITVEEVTAELDALDALLPQPGCARDGVGLRSDYTRCMTKSVGVHEAKTHLSRLLRLVGAGEEVTITMRGQEVARLVPPRAGRGPELGFDQGRFTVPDDFDAPLPAEVLDAFDS